MQIRLPQKEAMLPNENMPARLSRLAKRLKRALNHSSRTEELLDEVVSDLGDLQTSTGRSIPFPQNSAQTPGSIAVPRSGRFPRESPRGVAAVILVPNPDGSVAAHIDGRAGIALPPFVGALLEILKADRGPTSDSLVGWKSVAAIQLALKERSKQNHSKDAIKELVYRLRNQLERQGENRFLVQTNRRLGYRFALRRGAGTLNKSDNH